MIMYMVEVKNVKNSDTNKITYFQLVCGAWQRVSSDSGGGCSRRGGNCSNIGSLKRENIMNADLVKDYGAPAYAIYEVMENGNYRLMYEGGDWMRAMEVYRIAIAEGKKAVIM